MNKKIFLTNEAIENILLCDKNPIGIDNVSLKIDKNIFKTVNNKIIPVSFYRYHVNIIKNAKKLNYILDKVDFFYIFSMITYYSLIIRNFKRCVELPKKELLTKKATLMIKHFYSFYKLFSKHGFILETIQEIIESENYEFETNKEIYIDSLAEMIIESNFIEKEDDINFIFLLY
ncbi:MAG: hypothetical protein N2505_00515 [Endomicrobia bacterium]|nr:hypothetical protein [Endomicrobiia bacterium]